MVQSAHIREIGKFGKSMHKNTHPLVLCYNGSNHYAPTKSCSPEKFYQWKMEKELGPVLSAALFIIEEIDRNKLPSNVLNEINEVEAQIVKSLPIISKHSNTSHLRQAAMMEVPHRGPVFAQETGSQISGTAASSDLPSASSHAGTSSTSSSSLQPQIGAGQPVKKGRRPKKGGYVCHICNKKRDRKSDLDSHLWVAHRIGEPIQCNISPCNQRDFSTKGALKSHIKTQHKKKYEHNCRACDFGCESLIYYIEHRIKKHNIRMKTKKTGEYRIYHCTKCGKVIQRPASLSRHKQRGLCNQAKTVECSKCIKRFKTVKGRDKHYSQFHTEGARTWECPRDKCTTQLNSLNAYHNHQLWHNGMTSQIRRRIARERRKQQAQLKAYARHINRKRAKSPRFGDPDYSVASSKSAPAKVIPVRRSPRGHKGSKK